MAPCTVAVLRRIRLRVRYSGSLWDMCRLYALPAHLRALILHLECGLLRDLPWCHRRQPGTCNECVDTVTSLSLILTSIGQVDRPGGADDANHLRVFLSGDFRRGIPQHIPHPVHLWTFRGVGDQIKKRWWCDLMSEVYACMYCSSSFDRFILNRFLTNVPTRSR